MRLFTAVIGLLLLMGAVVPVWAQPEAPFEVDRHTQALWRMDSSEPSVDWETRFGSERSDRCYCAIRSNDGAYLLAGYSRSVRYNDFFLLKINDQGDSLWSRAYGGEYSETCRDLVQLPNGNIAMCGYSDSFGAGRTDNDYLLLVVDEDGDSLFSRTYGSEEEREECYSILIDEEGGFLLGGSGADDSIWLVKTDAQGDTIWTSHYDRYERQYCLGLLNTFEDAYLVLGSATTEEGPRGYVIKITPDGENIWENVYDCTNFNSAILENDCYIVTGYVYIDEEESEYVLFKIAPNGEVIWSDVYSLPMNDVAYDVIKTFDGGYAMIGYGYMGEYRNYQIIKVDHNGGQCWNRTYGGRYSGTAYEIVQIEDGSYFLFGYTSTENNSNDFYVVKTHPDLSVTTDMSGYYHTGELGGSADTSDGLWGQALFLRDDLGGYMSVPDHALFHTHFLTVECWFCMSDEQEQSSNLITKRLDDQSAAYELYASNADDLIGFAITTENGSYHVEYEAIPDDGEWHYIAGTYDNQWMALFYDGELVAQRDIRSPLIYGDGPLIIGSDRPVEQSDLLFYGLIDEVRISNVVRDYLRVDDPESVQPVSFGLSAYPNPFNGSTQIRFSLDRTSATTLVVYDLLGCEVARLMDSRLTAGDHSIVWDASDMPSGIYPIFLTADNLTETRKIVLIR